MVILVVLLATLALADVEQPANVLRVSARISQPVRPSRQPLADSEVTAGHHLPASEHLAHGQYDAGDSGVGKETLLQNSRLFFQGQLELGVPREWSCCSLQYVYSIGMII